MQAHLDELALTLQLPKDLAQQLKYQVQEAVSEAD